MRQPPPDSELGRLFAQFPRPLNLQEGADGKAKAYQVSGWCRWPKPWPEPNPAAFADADATTLPAAEARHS